MYECENFYVYKSGRELGMRSTNQPVNIDISPATSSGACLERRQSCDSVGWGTTFGLFAKCDGEKSESYLHKYKT